MTTFLARPLKARPTLLANETWDDLVFYSRATTAVKEKEVKKSDVSTPPNPNHDAPADAWAMLTQQDVL
jgi:hypothetical protein